MFIVLYLIDGIYFFNAPIYTGYPSTMFPLTCSLIKDRHTVIDT
jgi:hypothetical protein